MSTIELGCTCLETDFVPQRVNSQSTYKFTVTANENFAIGERSQVGRLLIRDGKDVEHEFAFRFDYSVQAETGLFPNPYYVGIVAKNDLRCTNRTKTMNN